MNLLVVENVVCSTKNLLFSRVLDIMQGNVNEGMGDQSGYDRIVSTVLDMSMFRIYSHGMNAFEYSGAWGMIAFEIFSLHRLTNTNQSRNPFAF